MGAHVTVTETNPVRALEAIMDGFNVTTGLDAAKIGEVFITVTGGFNTIGADHIKNMANGAIMANSGHFNDEIDIPALESMAVSHRTVRNFVEEYVMSDGRKVYLLGEGRLINLAAAEGHPSAVMDMSFANQAIAVLWQRNVDHGGRRLSTSVPDIRHCFIQRTLQRVISLVKRSRGSYNPATLGSEQ